jgi:cellulose synthase/poly-beta-1,6-N-acetylglucosamine synthase-like glycosyltransferase
VLRIAAAAGFAALIAFRLAATLTPPPKPAPHGRTRRDPPVYTILAPLHREADVAADLAAALSALDYPRDRLDIKLILEAGDVETIDAVAALDLSACFDVVVVPPGTPQTKPRALNYALASARGEFVTIYDAEDRPHPDQLNQALDAFDAHGDRLACVQAPLTWYNARETWLTRQFALEYAALFSVILPALARWGWPLPLGGTSNHFRRSALDAVGGWDAYNVTEDADLGFRLAEHGWTSTTIAAPTQEEAVTQIAPWTKQRSRWIKGFMQTLCVRQRNLARMTKHAGARGLGSIALNLALPVASSFLHAWLALAAVYAIATGGLSGAAAGFLGAGYASAAAAAYVGLKRSGQRRLALSIVTMPLYWPLHSYAALVALGELIVRPFHWAKTRHGVTALSPASSPRRDLSRDQIAQPADRPAAPAAIMPARTSGADAGHGPPRAP